MDGTPKLRRKSSLSLSTRLNQKRLSASPQNRLKTSAMNLELPQRSPSVISVCSDGGIECTPPHRKMAMNLDDSLEFSPKIFDSSFSPTCMLSQTLAIDSPEVGWKWSRHPAKSGGDVKRSGNENSPIHTPDSAYAADSSFASAGSSSTEVACNDRKIGDSHKQRIAKLARREDKRKLLEKEFRRVEKTRAEEKLKQRYAKLQEQLKSAGTQSSNINCQFNEENSNGTSKIFSNCYSSKNFEIKSQSATSTSTNVSVKLQTSEQLKSPELFNDFFNDSDSDCFLLKATQEIESKFEFGTQLAPINCNITTPKSPAAIYECTSIPEVNSGPAATSTPPTNKAVASKGNTSSSKSGNNEKRSSFYMKFLEDDCPDDWFISLDEVLLQATQNKKPRAPLQRYKSMPAETATNSNPVLNKKDKNSNCVTNSKENSSKRFKMIAEDAAASSSSSNMKRHSSIHALSPASTNYRSRRQL